MILQSNAKTVWIMQECRYSLTIRIRILLLKPNSIAQDRDTYSKISNFWLHKSAMWGAIKIKWWMVNSFSQKKGHAWQLPFPFPPALKVINVMISGCLNIFSFCTVFIHIQKQVLLIRKRLIKANYFHWITYRLYTVLLYRVFYLFVLSHIQVAITPSFTLFLFRWTYLLRSRAFEWDIDHISIRKSCNYRE